MERQAGSRGQRRAVGIDRETGSRQGGMQGVDREAGSRKRGKQAVTGAAGSRPISMYFKKIASGQRGRQPVKSKAYTLMQPRREVVKKNSQFHPSFPSKYQNCRLVSRRLLIGS